jgi:alpha-glucosidase (family GH31 glycosyl hydrolase)
VIAALAVPAAAAAADVTVTSGALTARAATGAWRLSFTQPRGGGFDESPATAGDGPAGTLGFKTALGWVHAVRVVSSRRDREAAVLAVATNDPAGRGLEVRIEPAGVGVISVRASITGPPHADVTAVGIGFGARPGEHFYGLGERSTPLDQRGRDVENYVSDGPFSPETRPFVAATIPPQGYRPRDDATYYPVPWLVSSRGIGFLLDNDETSTFHVGSSPADVWSVEAEAKSLSFRVFAGPTPARVVRRFTAATGRQPAPTAAWQFGPWFQTGQPNVVPLADEASWLRKLRAADAPVSAAETQLRYLPCGLDRGNEDYESKRVKFFHEQGLAILTYVNPMVCASYKPFYDDAAAAGALQRGLAGQPYTFNSFVGGTGPAGFTIQPVAEFDFTSPAGIGVYSSVLKRILAAGHDGWMEDFGEYTPTDTQPRDGSPGATMHNRYPTTYHCAVSKFAGKRPLVRFQRSGWTGAARCASDVWGGDPTTGWGYDGLSSAIRQALSIGMSGVSRWGSDIGGYDTIGNDPKLTPELLKRWIEFGAVSGVMRTKSSGIAIPSYRRPQIWDPEIVPVWRRYAKLHTQLYPYLLAADATYRETGIPLMRALVLLDPADRAAATVDDEFGFGPDLLAAPVITEGARRRDVRLPRGRWIEWSEAIRYDTRDGSLHVVGGREVAGRSTRSVRAEVGELPLFLRSGTILPLLSPDVSTLADDGTGVVHLEDRLDRLRLLVFPRGTSKGRAFERDRFRSAVHRRYWALSIRATRRRKYRVEASTRYLPFRPCTIAVRRRALARRSWRFDARRRVLRVDFKAPRRALLTVRACPLQAR